ncbi:hypothetical protein O3Q51_03880 [Cryomorphaceae bacterium 1068]|nr:hypothetical protein [Cryomorphaceae bacterium 1068]
MACRLMEESPKKTSFIAPAEFEALRQKTLLQIEKDFRLQGIEIKIDDEAQPYSELVKVISKSLEDLQVHDNSKLQPLLYQLDISEKFVREQILSKKQEEHSASLADAVIKRCFAKVVFRKKYS